MDNGQEPSAAGRKYTKRQEAEGRRLLCLLLVRSHLGR